jgi:crotonobetainyl-CoA:carnitine CoA-transferase CaiB-like acyl-CoA transferase
VPLVVDLSTLWAGPLCAHLLGLAGARVVKVESHARPDGARRGPAAFYDLLNAGKDSVALDLRTADGRETLRRLIARADVVVESARPRALVQLGIDVGEIVARIPGLTWVSITGYGRAEPGGSWVAFGDDAAAAAGLAVATGASAARSGSPSAATPLFCGDAIADPLTGLIAAVAAQEAWRAGGGTLLDVALRDVVAHVLGSQSPCGVATVRPCDAPDGWEVVAGRERQRVLPPRARTPTGRARPLGADTERVLRSLDLAC